MLIRRNINAHVLLSVRRNINAHVLLSVERYINQCKQTSIIQKRQLMGKGRLFRFSKFEIGFYLSLHCHNLVFYIILYRG